MTRWLVKVCVPAEALRWPRLTFSFPGCVDPSLGPPRWMLEGPVRYPGGWRLPLFG